MTNRLGSNHLLISTLAKRRQASKNPLQAGFTLVELLVVIIIIGILTAIALPAFLGQANKAKDSGAKAFVAGTEKECQVALFETGAVPTTFQTSAGDGITVNNQDCANISAQGDYTGSPVFTSSVDPATGTVTRTGFTATPATP